MSNLPADNPYAQTYETFTSETKTRQSVTALVARSDINVNVSTGAMTTTISTTKGLVQAAVLMPVGAQEGEDMAVSFLPRPFQKKNGGVKWTAEEVGFKNVVQICLPKSHPTPLNNSHL